MVIPNIHMVIRNVKKPHYLVPLMDKSNQNPKPSAPTLKQMESILNLKKYYYINKSKSNL